MSIDDILFLVWAPIIVTVIAVVFTGCAFALKKCWEVWRDEILRRPKGGRG